MALELTVTNALKDLLGDRFSQAPSEREHHAGNEAYHRPCWPDAVVWPLTTQEVAQIVRICSDNGIPVIPHGLGSSLEGHLSAVRGGICIDMMRMEAVLRVSTDDLDCTVEAGITREALNLHLRDTGLFFPVDPGANATLGGMCATRASGTSAVRYGTMAENVLNLTVVTPQGEVIRTARRARKSAAGYDLTHLYLGSEGTLGIITEVTLRLHPRSEAALAMVCSFPDTVTASRTAIEAIQCGFNPARLEYLDDNAITAVNSYSGMSEIVGDTLFVELAGDIDTIQRQVELLRSIAQGNGCRDFRWAEREEDRNKLWKARHSAYPAIVAMRPGAKGWSSDVCVPIGSLAQCIVDTKSLLAGCGIPNAIIGHVGDGNFHVVFAVIPEEAEEMKQVMEINASIVALALGMDGTCTGEHGIGLGKQKYMALEHGAALSVMRLLKEALDPQNIFNPGKIFPS